MFISTLDTVFSLRSSFSSIVDLLFFSDSTSSGRCALLLLLAVVCVPFVYGVTCNSQNVIGLPDLFIGLVDLSLVDFRIFCSFWFLIGSMFSDFPKSVFTSLVYHGDCVRFLFRGWSCVDCCSMCWCVVSISN